ncbi:hypothetical protein SNARM312S_07082 [Streptomyces narbonensis]
MAKDARETHAGPDPVGDMRREGKRLRRDFSWLAVLGALLVLGGVVGLVYTGLATLTSMLLFGWLLLIGGVVGLLHAIQSRGTSYFWLAVVVAALNIAAGVVVIRHPEGSAEALTMFAALLFLTGGLFRLVGSVVVRGPQFGWTLLQGAFGLLLGLLVLFDWPESSRYVLGVFFSPALLFDEPRPDRDRRRRQAHRRYGDAATRTGRRRPPRRSRRIRGLQKRTDPSKRTWRPARIGRLQDDTPV